MIAQDRDRAGVKIARPGVIAKPLPGVQHVGLVGARERGAHPLLLFARR